MLTLKKPGTIDKRFVLLPVIFFMGYLGSLAVLTRFAPVRQSDNTVSTVASPRKTAGSSVRTSDQPAAQSSAATPSVASPAQTTGPSSSSTQTPAASTSTTTTTTDTTTTSDPGSNTSTAGTGIVAVPITGPITNLQ